MGEHEDPDDRRIVVIGPCASGKTTLVAKLKELGYDAHACGQEHSEITELWRHLSPDVVIGLQIDLETLRHRRSATWSDRVYARQLTRLESGYDRADVLIDCDTFDADEVIRQVVGWLGATQAE